MTAPVATARTQADPIAPDCPRCCASPLRFVSSGHGSDASGGGTYTCNACGYSTARDLLVAGLMGRLRRAEDTLWNYARASLPGFVRDRLAGEHRCPECEVRWRDAVVAALDRADGRARAEGEDLKASQERSP